MAIGEFGGAPAATGDSGPMYAGPAYWLYEMSQAALNPSRAFADAARLFYRNPANPLSYTSFGKSMAAGLELFERSTRRYGKPDWNINSTVVGGQQRAGAHFVAYGSGRSAGCCISSAPSSTCRAGRSRACSSLRRCRAITRPCCAARSRASCPTTTSTSPNGSTRAWSRCPEGGFDLDDYIDYVISMLHVLGGDVHVLAVCQPSVPVLAAVARMEAEDDPYVPHSMVLMGGPDRYARESDRSEQARGDTRHRLVPPQRHHQGAVSQSGVHARRLSGLPAAARLRQHESRSAHRGAPQAVPPSGPGRRRFCAEAPRVLRRISRGHGSCRRVLSADRRDRVRASRAAQGRDDASRAFASIPRRSAASRCSRWRARTTTFPASVRPRRRTSSASTFRRSARRTGCSPPSVTTACSTARGFGPRSCRAFPTSCCRTIPLRAMPPSVRPRASPCWRRTAAPQMRRRRRR